MVWLKLLVALAGLYLAYLGIVTVGFGLSHGAETSLGLVMFAILSVLPLAIIAIMGPASAKRPKFSRRVVLPVLCLSGAIYAIGGAIFVFGTVYHGSLYVVGMLYGLALIGFASILHRALRQPPPA